MFYGAYDRFLDREWDRYCERWEIKDGEYEAAVKFGPLYVTIRYRVLQGEPHEVIGLYIKAWCTRTLKSEEVEISDSVEYSDEEIFALVNPEKDRIVRVGIQDECDGPD